MAEHTGRIFRQATLILPSTGERVKRDFTLRDPKLFGNVTESTPLLADGSNKPVPKTRRQIIVEKTKGLAKDAWAFAKSENGHGILKCSVAYFVATLATFQPQVARILGTHQDTNQFIATVVVWFDPARTLGSMDLAMMLALLAFSFSAVIGYGSMLLSAALEPRGLIVLAHALAVVFGIGGGLGFISWLKQYVNHPLFNTSTSVASMGIVGVLTKEGAVQSGDISHERTTQTLQNLCVGMAVTLLINLTIWPVSASRKVRTDISNATDAMGVLLSTVTSSFLSGVEEEMKHPTATAASDKLKSAMSALPKDLAEARYEHFLLGTERQYHVDERMLNCMQQLSQDIGGLRSASATQFELLKEKPEEQKYEQHEIHANGNAGPNHESSQPTNAERSRRPSEVSSRLSILDSREQEESNALFETFINNMGPPMKSLAYTLKEMLKELPPIRDVKEATAANRANFKPSIQEAIHHYVEARKEAQRLVYLSKGISEARSSLIAAEFEEVAASCGHFGSSLQDFAEHCLEYLDVLDEVEEEIHGRPYGRTWTWLAFWKHPQRRLDIEEFPDEDLGLPNTLSAPTVPINRQTKQDGATDAPKTFLSRIRSLYCHIVEPYWLYPYFQVFRREDVRYAIKVGTGAAFFALFAFIPSTRDWYNHWHFEWALVAFMVVCAMNVGISNNMTWSRIYGTLAGGGLAIVVWNLCHGNPYALAASGWVVSLVAFYYIVAGGQAPMGRFILLAYSLSVLYSYGLTVSEPDPYAGHDHGLFVQTDIYHVVYHRVVAIMLGCVGGLVITRLVWPISARKKVRLGLSLLWLRMSLVWKRGPLSVITKPDEPPPKYMDIRQEAGLRTYANTLDGLRKNAESEITLKGPFPSSHFDELLKSTTRMLDAFHALHVIIQKEERSSDGERELLNFTSKERGELARRISHLLSVLASSLHMEYPLNDTLPNIEQPRERLLSRIFEFRQNAKTRVIMDEDYELLYAYLLVTAQIAKEIEISGKELETMYGVLDEEFLMLR